MYYDVVLNVAPRRNALLVAEERLERLKAQQRTGLNTTATGPTPPMAPPEPPRYMRPTAASLRVFARSEEAHRQAFIENRARLDNRAGGRKQLRPLTRSRSCAHSQALSTSGWERVSTAHTSSSSSDARLKLRTTNSELEAESLEEFDKLDATISGPDRPNLGPNRPMVQFVSPTRWLLPTASPPDRRCASAPRSRADGNRHRGENRPQRPKDRLQSDADHLQHDTGGDLPSEEGVIGRFVDGLLDQVAITKGNRQEVI